MTTSLPLERTRWLAVLLIWCAGFGAAAQFAKISVTYDTLSLIYADAPLGIGVIVGILGITGLVGGATAGLLISRLGPARLLIAALIFGAVLSVLQASLPPYPVLLLLRLIEGLSHIVVVVAGPTLIVAVAAPRDHGTVMALWAGFFGVGFALTAWLGLPLVTAYGVGALFLGHAAVLVILAGLLSLVGLPRLPRAETPKLGWLAQHLAIYRALPTALPGAVFLWHTISFVALLTLLPGFGAPEDRVLLATSLPISGLLGTFAAMALIRRGTSLKAVAILGFAGIVVLTICARPFVDTTLFLPIAACLTFCAGLVPAAAFALVPSLNHNPISQSRANGAIAQLGNLGTVSGTPIMAAVIGVAGFPGLMALTICFALIGTAITVLGTARAG